MQWKKARGFSSRRILEIAEYKGFKFKVTDKEFVNSRYKKSKYFLAFIDNDFLGYASTLNGAKLICQLQMEI